MEPLLLIHRAVTGPVCSFFAHRISLEEREATTKVLSLDPLTTTSLVCVRSKHSIESLCSLKKGKYELAEPTSP